MAKEKQKVFSARTTEVGLKALNEVKGRLKVSWDELVIDAVSAHYGLDKAAMSLPRKEKAAKEAPITAEHTKVKTGKSKQMKGQKKGRKATAAEQTS